MATASPVASEPEGRYEVVGSEITEKPPMGTYEVVVASMLFEILAPFVRAQGLGRVVSEMLFDLRPQVDRDRRPDLAFVSAATWPLERRTPRTPSWKLVPDLAIEVISPTNLANDVLAKVREYLRAGSRAVWVVYPIEAEIHVFEAGEPSIVRRLGRADVLEAAVVPGFRLALADLFEDDGPTAA